MFYLCYMKAEVLNRTDTTATIRWTDPKLGFGEITMKWDHMTGRMIVDTEMLGIASTINILKSIE